MKSNCSDIYSKILSGSEESENSEIMQKPSMVWQNLQEIDSDDNAEIKTICVFCFQLFSSTEMMNEHIQTCHKTLGEKQKFDFKNDSPTQEIFSETETQIEKKKANERKRLKENSSEKEKHHYIPSLNSQETFICSCCYERLPNFKSFLIHMETHVASLKTKTGNHCDEDTRENFMLPLNNYLCCCHCNKFFEDSEKLQEHLVEHHVMTFYKCSLCEQTFEDFLIMKAHLIKNHASNREHFECSNCAEGPKLFHDRISAELHLSKHHSINKTVDNWQEGPRISLEGNGASIRDEYLNNYVKNSSVVPTATNYRCAYCKEYRASKNDLQLHLRTHQISEKSRHKCNICDETFTSSPELANHKLSHCKIIESNMCVPCKTIILDEESFVKHQLKHSDNSKSTAKLNLILPSICIVCGQTLQSDKEIELHAKFHLKFLSEQTRSKTCKSPFPEEIVPSNSETSTTDFRGTLDATLELQCHLCKKSFSDKGQLQVHLIEHNFFGINQFSCYICSSVFTGAAGLQSHLSNHNLAEKPYQCSVCSAGFLFRAELDNHKYLHSFKLQFDCLSDESISQARHFTNAWVAREISTSESH
ncbi:unnamed protein product [Ceutorhynchus assimilis]|uniref:C2H2-type domain-containing protein n=1 Tax=Ceutorhynchus assimilis TaxID=467358 RepID=A0A9N9MCH4_9CUCU|nr:unnamed protein product [Ceutorhynchus assimilis]